MRRLPILAALLACSAIAHAGEQPLYAPAPDWVLPAPPIDATALTDSSPALVVFDAQTRLTHGVTWSYVDTATRASSAPMLGQMGNIAIPWMPDRGDLTIHRLEIVRGTEHIDLLKSGQRFTVLRREEMMEQRMLTGILTASMSVEGLRVGDVLRMTVSISQADPALRGNEVGAVPIIAAPQRAGFARARLSWPTGEKISWKGYATGLGAVEKTVGGFHEVTVTLPLAKQPEMPDDLPQRYIRPPIVEASSFADWQAVSRTFAPLYTTDGLIAPGGELAREVQAIAAAESDPLRRAQRALELVQDKVRYLAIAMNGGGLTPQAPAKTWALRYGDCKAKTLLLLAILHQLGITAEPALASAQTGGLVAERLPGVGAFDHVIVHATVNGESLWLDGTRLGDRIEDIRDTPPFRYVLPVRAAGAALTPLAIHASARPQRIVDIRYDQSAAIDMPTAFDATITIRGGYAQMLDGMMREANAEQKRDLVQSMMSAEVGEFQMSRHAFAYDPATAIAMTTASGVATTPWRREERRYRLVADRAVNAINFAPDRARAAWHDLPVATNGLDSVVYRSTVRLPVGVGGYTLEGDRTLPATLAGRLLKRNVTLNGDQLVLEDRIDSIGAEIAPADLPAERARYTQAQAKLLSVIAPEKLPSRAEVVLAARRDGRFKPIEAAFAAAIAAAEPDDTTPYSSRASFRAGIYDRDGAIADFSKMIAMAPDPETYVKRGAQYEAIGQRAKAIADYQAARALDPANDNALSALADALDRGGDEKGALALLDERIALGDQNRYWAIGTKAETLAMNGKAGDGVALLDTAITAKPGDPMLLNLRCWTKGIGNIALDTALKDCSKAIELGDSPAAPLDSRALAYFRLGRMDDALADLDAALDAAPREPGSLFLRAIVRKRLGQPGGAQDLAAARLIDPQIDVRYRRFGITA